MSVEVKQKQQLGESLRKEPEMAYKKPKLVADSAKKQVFVADRCQDLSRNIHGTPITCRR